MVYRLVNSTYNVEELTLRLTRLLCQFIKAQSSSVLLLDSSKKKIVLVAIFDNKINILKTKASELASVTEDEKKVSRGTSVFEKHFLAVPLVADDNVGAVFLRRGPDEPAFTPFDRDLLAVVAEQSVTAIRNLQLYEEQQKIILGSIEFIGKLLQKQKYVQANSPAYFKIIKALAQKLGMGQSSIDNLYYASILHAAGAVDVPYETLSKKSHLTPEEFKIIRTLPAKSVELIKPVAFLKPVLPIILYRREKYDGSGYPSGLMKEQIPLGARIMAVVDAFEAMVHGRPYRGQITINEALQELKKNSGTQFDPKVVSAFLGLSEQKKFRNYLSSTNG
jgi:HD-GYP domain-containing protein (c-di-GMP phosphodiesterase class II)